MGGIWKGTIDAQGRMSFGNIGRKCVQPFEMLGSTQESCVDNQMPGLTQMKHLRLTNYKGRVDKALVTSQ